jgi:SSS family solute:Na+ symporter
MYAWTVCFVVTIILTFFTKQLKTIDELRGLVYSLTPKTHDEPGIVWYEKPLVLAVIMGTISIVLTIIFW